MSDHNPLGLTMDDFDETLMAAGTVIGTEDGSVAEGLEVLRGALLERWNMIVPDSYLWQYPVPVIGSFVAGDLMDSTFVDSFIAMIDGYYDLFFNIMKSRSSSDYRFVTSGAMTDVVNAADYEITSTDLQATMTTEAWNIISGNFSASTSWLEFWRGDVILGMYEIFKATQYFHWHLATSSVEPNATGIRAQMVSVPSAHERYTSPFGDGGTWADAEADINWTLVSGTTIGAIALMGVDMWATNDQNGWPPHGRIEKLNTNLGNLKEQSGCEFVLRLEDMDGGILTVDYVTASVITDNIVENRHINGPYPSGPIDDVSEAPVAYDGRWSVHEYLNSSDFEVADNAAIMTQSQANGGTSQVYDLGYSKPIGYQTSPYIASDNWYSVQAFSYGQPNIVVVDLNNSGLDYVIT